MPQKFQQLKKSKKFSKSSKKWLLRQVNDQFVERAKIETRQYAKRQMTWWRHTMPDWTFYSATDPSVLFMQILQRINTPSS